MIQLKKLAVDTLIKMIKTPSLSKEEDQVVQIIRQVFHDYGVKYEVFGNNTWAKNKFFEASKPTILLNSHIDTVKVVDGWNYDPFGAERDGDIIYGLGSNDAGASVVSLMATFLHFYNRQDLAYNLIFAPSADEETDGKAGIVNVLPKLDQLSFGIVGEPTEMHLAVAEKGLLVLDCIARGSAGHAARDEGDNAIFHAIDDIQKIQNFTFPKVSEVVGPVKMTTTMIKAGLQHNIIPDTCSFTVDVRTNEHYTNLEIVDIISDLIESDVRPRSTNLNSSGISLQHPIVLKGQSLGRNLYGSPTLSDQARMSFPTLKIGPGDSARSHTANEYIRISEIEFGIDTYIQLLEGLKI